LLVQSKQISSDRHVHRAVWDDGRPDEWICLEEHRWLLERDYKKFSAPDASKSSRSVKKVTTSTTESDAPSGARAKRVRPKRVSRRRTTDSEPTESEDPDSFLASSDEVLPQRRAPRAAASSSAARVTDKPGKPRTKKGSGVFPEIDSNASPLKSHYVRGITPPPVFYGDKSWMEVLEEQERARRASVEQIRSARDLPIRLATLFWPRCKKELHAPNGVREALERLFENGRSLTLPQVNAAKTPCQRWRGLLLPAGYSTQACDCDRSHSMIATNTLNTSDICALPVFSSLFLTFSSFSSSLYSLLSCLQNHHFSRIIQRGYTLECTPNLYYCRLFVIIFLTLSL